METYGGVEAIAQKLKTSPTNGVNSDDTGTNAIKVKKKIRKKFKKFKKNLKKIKEKIKKKIILKSLFKHLF